MNITIKGGLYFDTDSVKYGTSKIKFVGGPLSKFADQYLPICEHTIEAELPDGYDPTLLEIDSLKEARKQAEQQFAATVRQIDQRINSLLAIGCATEVA
jgi:hypothetical protein